MNQRISLIAAVGAGALLLAGCGKTNAPPPAAAAAPPAAVKQEKAEVKTEAAKSAPSVMPKAIADIQAKGNYTVLILHKGEAIDELKGGLEPLARDAGKCVITTMRADDEGLKPFFAQQRVDAGAMPTPIAIMVAPNGVVSGVFTKTPTKERFAQAILPKQPLAVRKALLDGKTVIVKFQAPTTTGNDETNKAIAQFLAAPGNSDKYVAIGVDLDKAENLTFLKQLGIDPDKEKASVIFGMAPPLKIISRPFRGAATLKDVSNAVNPACATGCGPTG